jgi:hypothetical protein
MKHERAAVYEILDQFQAPLRYMDNANKEEFLNMLLSAPQNDDYDVTHSLTINFRMSGFIAPQPKFTITVTPVPDCNAHLALHIYDPKHRRSKLRLFFKMCLGEDCFEPYRESAPKQWLKELGYEN